MFLSFINSKQTQYLHRFSNSSWASCWQFLCQLLVPLHCPEKSHSETNNGSHQCDPYSSDTSACETVPLLALLQSWWSWGASSWGVEANRPVGRIRLYGARTDAHELTRRVVERVNEGPVGEIALVEFVLLLSVPIGAVGVKPRLFVDDVQAYVVVVVAQVIPPKKFKKKLKIFHLFSFIFFQGLLTIFLKTCRTRTRTCSRRRILPGCSGEPGFPRCSCTSRRHRSWALFFRGTCRFHGAWSRCRRSSWSMLLLKSF